MDEPPLLLPHVGDRFRMLKLQHPLWPSGSEASRERSGNTSNNNLVCHPLERPLRFVCPSPGLSRVPSTREALKIRLSIAWGFQYAITRGPIDSLSIAWTFSAIHSRGPKILLSIACFSCAIHSEALKILCPSRLSLPSTREALKIRLSIAWLVTSTYSHVVPSTRGVTIHLSIPRLSLYHPLRALDSFVHRLGFSPCASTQRETLRCCHHWVWTSHAIPLQRPLKDSFVLLT
ncbi:hypothetical protein AVEN_192300-1 [Araneus ventricosus]|uniref:Uncharacterized protein n=1 Tax=Araneus ventricosus TaxID=182803 RepID=A0A4Y2JLB9_ARAVE|nr:hypothetical protein AVEN_192300-1 [Araneus ventricosus]